MHCLVGACVQHLVFGVKSCLQRIRKSVNVFWKPLRSYGFWQSGLCVWPFGDTILSAEASQERECLGDAFVQHLALGRKSCPQRVRKSVNDLAGAVQDIQHDSNRHLGARRNDIAA